MNNSFTYIDSEGSADQLVQSLWWLSQLVLCCGNINITPLADLRGGGRQGRAPPPPWGSKFFHFHAVFSKYLKNNSTFGSWRTPLGKILDPPLIYPTIEQELYPTDRQEIISMHSSRIRTVRLLTVSCSIQ